MCAAMCAVVGGHARGAMRVRGWGVGGEASGCMCAVVGAMCAVLAGDARDGVGEVRCSAGCMRAAHAREWCKAIDEIDRR